MRNVLKDVCKEKDQAHCGLPLTRFVILGVGGFPLPWTPLSCGVPEEAGVGADTGPSSSAFTAEGLLRLLFWLGEVLALGPLEFVPC